MDWLSYLHVVAMLDNGEGNSYNVETMQKQASLHGEFHLHSVIMANCICLESFACAIVHVNNVLRQFGTENTLSMEQQTLATKL